MIDRQIDRQIDRYISAFSPSPHIVVSCGRSSTMVFKTRCWYGCGLLKYRELLPPQQRIYKEVISYMNQHHFSSYHIGTHLRCVPIPLYLLQANRYRLGSGESKHLQLYCQHAAIFVRACYEAQVLGRDYGLLSISPSFSSSYLSL